MACHSSVTSPSCRVSRDLRFGGRETRSATISGSESLDMDTGFLERGFMGVNEVDGAFCGCGAVDVAVLRWKESRWLNVGSPLLADDLATGGDGGSISASPSSSKLKDMKSALSATLSTFAA